MTWKTVSCKIDEEDYDTIQNCIESGSHENTSEFVRDAIENFIENRVVEFTTESEANTPTRTLTLEDGKLWYPWEKSNDGTRYRTGIGYASKFELTNGKVYNDSGQIMGIIKNQD